MKRLALILTLIATPGWATPLDPPAHFRGPVQPMERIHIHILPTKDVRPTCGAAFGVAMPFVVDGCAVPMTDGSCHVYVARSPQLARDRDRLIAHEVAHCRGWPAGHPL